MPMSINRTSQTVNEIIQRALKDAGFRNQLLSDPAAALSGYTLTADERAALSDPKAVKAALDDWEAPVT